MDTCQILKESKVIAVVGISDKPERDSGSIALYLQKNGYTVYGVHPILKNVGDIQVFKSLNEIPEPVDIVDVFLASERIDGIMPDVLAIKPKYLWLQMGITNSNAWQLCNENEIGFVQDTCIAVELRHCASRF